MKHFKPKHIIFTGIAGAVNPELQPGDIVIAEKTAHHDMGNVLDKQMFYILAAKNSSDRVVEMTGLLGSELSAEKGNGIKKSGG